MAIDKNVNPYYDDFDEFKNYHQILFKPGLAVQARELTQIQSILKNQIEKFGNHIFKQGSVVIPGNSFADLAVPYAKIESSYAGVPVEVNRFIGFEVVGATSGVIAFVKDYAPAETSAPLTLYFSYVSGGTTDGIPNGKNVFEPGEELFVRGEPTVRVTIQSGATSVGEGSIAYINRGVFFVNGTFVTVDKQSVVIERYSSVPDCRVLLRIDEKIVDANEDFELLDPAQGSNNFAAPGADRFKLSLTLISLPLTTPLTDDYVEIMRYRQGVLEEHSRYPKYSELEKSLARRTYDESGSYLVSGFNPSTREHLKTRFNDGAFVDGNRDQFVLELTPGKGYVEGLEVEKIAKTSISLDKGRAADHVLTSTATSIVSYGKFLYVSNLVSLPNFANKQIVELFDVSDRGDLTGVKIGEMRAVAIDYHAGDPVSAGAIYKLFFTDLTLNQGIVVEDIGGVRFDSVGAAKVLTRYSVKNASFDFIEDSVVVNNADTREATVRRFVRATGELFVHRHDRTKQIPKNGEFITGDSGSSPTGTISSVETVLGEGGNTIIKLTDNVVKSIKDVGTNLYTIQYTSWEHVSLTIGAGGSASFTATDGTLRQIEVGTAVAASNLGPVSLSRLSVSGGNTLTVTGTTGEVVRVLLQVVKSARQPKQKIYSDNDSSPLVVAPSDVVMLGKTDVIRVKTIIQDGVDVSRLFRFNNGQTDYYYGISYLTRIGDLPSSDDLEITFDYFEHTGTGDYFCVDSYESMGVDYLGRVPTYRSKTTSEIFELSKCVDFRPSINSSGSFTGTGSSNTDYPVIGEFVSTGLQIYGHRFDTVYLDKSGGILISRGVPSLNPKEATVPAGGLGISNILIPAYTFRMSDISVRTMGNIRYTMGDIKKLERRIETLEFFSTLSSLEYSLLSTDVLDEETGLARFKTGFMADNFRDPFVIADILNRNFRASFYDKVMSADVRDTEAMMYILDGSLNYEITNKSDVFEDLGESSTPDAYITRGQISLPYDEFPLVDQNLSTRITNLNPFMVFEWEGLMTLQPAVEIWTEIEFLEDIFRTEEESVEIRQPDIPCPAYSGGGGGEWEYYDDTVMVRFPGSDYPELNYGFDTVVYVDRYTLFGNMSTGAPVISADLRAWDSGNYHYSYGYDVTNVIPPATAPDVLQQLQRGY